MTRIVEHAETGPAAVPKDRVPGTQIHVCRCGLSASPPLCDGSHRATRDEPPGALFRYRRVDGILVREPVEVLPAEAPRP